MDGTPPRSRATDGPSSPAPYLVAALLACTLALLEPITGGELFFHGALEQSLAGLAVAAAGGLAVLWLVRDARRHAAESRRRAEALAESEEAIATVAGELSSGPGAREQICKAAAKVSGATLVSLYEPDGHGGLAPTAGAGTQLPPVALDLARDPSGVALTFATRRRVLVPDAERERIVSPRLLAVSGARSMQFEPVLRGEEAVGVLVLGWRDPIEDLTDRPLGAVRLLAAEVAIAIERERLLAELEAAARTDPLTGLANRRVWEGELPRELTRAARYGQPVAVALLDIDRFKVFNDEHGHQAGDALLRNAAAAWSEQLRDVDLLARYGGEEFAILLPNSGLDVARRAVDRVREATPGGQTCSAGVAEWDGIEDAESLLARADQALYVAKREGRDCTRPSSLLH